MVIYMQHEKHGTKVACSEDEAKADELLGWQRYRLGATLDVPIVDGPILAVQKRRGRPPKVSV